MGENIWLKRFQLSAVIGAVLFIASLLLMVYSRWAHGMPNSFYIYLAIWPQLVVYLVMCFVAGCGIYLIASFVVSVVRRLRTNLPH